MQNADKETLSEREFKASNDLGMRTISGRMTAGLQGKSADGASGGVDGDGYDGTRTSAAVSDVLPPASPQQQAQQQQAGAGAEEELEKLTLNDAFPADE